MLMSPTATRGASTWGDNRICPERAGTAGAAPQIPRLAGELAPARRRSAPRRRDILHAMGSLAGNIPRQTVVDGEGGAHRPTRAAILADGTIARSAERASRPTGNRPPIPGRYFRKRGRLGEAYRLHGYPRPA